MARTSPSLAASLSECMFRAAQEHIPEIQELLGKAPSALIGTIAHAVVDRALRFADLPLSSGQGQGRQAIARQLWEEEEENLIRSLPPVALPEPARWPHYAMKRARTCALAASLLHGSTEKERRLSPFPPHFLTSEVEFQACDGRLAGRIDHLVRTEEGLVVEDLKTGEIRDDGGKLIDVYRRQVLIYAFLVHENLGEWPSSVRLVSVNGDSLEQSIEPNESIRLVETVLRDLTRYNQVASSLEGDAPAQMRTLAAPSPEACRWCRVRAWCAPYWEVKGDWPNANPSRADVGGILAQDWTSGQSMQLGLEGNLREITLGVLPLHVAGGPSNLPKGTRIRCLRARVVQEDKTFHADLYAELWWEGTI